MTFQTFHLSAPVALLKDSVAVMSAACRAVVEVRSARRSAAGSRCLPCRTKCRVKVAVAYIRRNHKVLYILPTKVKRQVIAAQASMQYPCSFKLQADLARRLCNISSGLMTAIAQQYRAITSRSQQADVPTVIFAIELHADRLAALFLHTQTLATPAEELAIKERL